MRIKIFLILFASILLFSGCKFSYGFTGTNINYNETKSIQIHEFTNQAATVYPTLAQTFSEKMRDVYTRSTKLKFTDKNPDIEIDGEITKYDLTQQAVKDNAYASESRLTMGIMVRFRNNRNPTQNKEYTFSAYRDFSNQNMLTDVQDQLISEMNTELVDEVFNATMSNW